MGNSSSKKIDVTQFDPQQWKQIMVHRQISKIVESTKGKGYAQLQTIPFDSRRDLEKQIQIYQYRKDQDNALVKCLGILPQKSKSHAICGDNKMLKVLTERIPARLGQLPQLSFPESLYTLSESLRGYKQCYNKLGPFSVTDEMIGINNQGEIKVWVNQDFAQNHPTFEKPALQVTGSASYNQKIQDLVGNKEEADMVRNIVQIIEKKNENGKFSPQFKDRITKNSKSFNQTFKQIQLYATQKNMFIPDRILNLKKGYNSSSAFFTPGQQYVRAQNDPLYRPPKQNQTQQPIIQPLQGGRVNSPIIYNQPSSLSSLNRINSPIQALHQEFPKQNSGFYQNDSRMHPLGSKVTFNVMSPNNSTLVFNKQTSVVPHPI